MGFRCIQINLHHAKAASAVLAQRFNSDHLDVALIQEPYIYNDQVRCLTGELLYDSYNVGKPRACILLRNGINSLPIPEHTTKDQVAIRAFVPTATGMTEIVLCSAYLPGDSNDLEFLPLQGLVNYCGRNNLQLIIGCDSNAHHTLWGSTNINSRGECLLEFLNNSRLEILNMGSSPTFIN